MSRLVEYHNQEHEFAQLKKFAQELGYEPFHTQLHKAIVKLSSHIGSHKNLARCSKSNDPFPIAHSELEDQQINGAKLSIFPTK
jgi:hypothetical protein